MKKLKLFLQLLFSITVLTQSMQAQQNAKGIKDNGIKSHTHVRGCCQYRMIYVGGGLNNAPAVSSSAAFKSNGINTIGFNLDYSQTFLRKPGFSIGYNVGGQYFSGSGDPFAGVLPPPFLVSGQISSDVKSSGDSKNSGYFVGAGPQFNFHFASRFVFSPIFQIGYLNVTQSDFKATQTTLMQGFTLPNYTRTYDLISQSQTKTSGLGIIPKARLSYMFSKSIGIWAEANYLLGPTVKNSITTFKPEGQPNQQGSYTIQQMNVGTYTTTVNETKNNALGFAGGLVYSFGKNDNDNAELAESNTVVTTDNNTIKPKPKTEPVNDENPDKNDIVFSSSLVRNDKAENQNRPCIQIVSPSNGSNENVGENMKVVLQNPSKMKSETTIYKISNDKNFWSKPENKKDLIDTQNTVFLSSRYQKESEATGFKPMAISTTQKGDNQEAIIEKGKLSEGSYKMVVASNCGVSTSNFKVSSGDITITSLTTTCKERFGDYSYTCVVKNFDTSPINITNIVASLSTGTITGLTFAPALPIVLAAGATQIFTGSFSYAGTYTGNVYLQVSGYTVGDSADVEVSTRKADLKSCICDYCEKVLEFDNNNTQNATYNVAGNSLAIHQDWWSMGSASGTVVAAKAEIVSFVREVSDDCMKCDKDSNQWGNFISGKSGAVAGSFGNANSGVTGNTHHTLYFANPNSYSFDTNISIPPLSVLSCCCEKIRIKIRYTYTFKDASGNCKMCSAVFEYYFQKGCCKTVDPSDYNPLGISVKTDQLNNTKN